MRYHNRSFMSFYYEQILIQLNNVYKIKCSLDDMELNFYTLSEDKNNFTFKIKNENKFYKYMEIFGHIFKKIYDTDFINAYQYKIYDDRQDTYFIYDFFSFNHNCSDSNLLWYSMTLLESASKGHNSIKLDFNYNCNQQAEDVDFSDKDEDEFNNCWSYLRELELPEIDEIIYFGRGYKCD